MLDCKSTIVFSPIVSTDTAQVHSKADLQSDVMMFHCTSECPSCHYKKPWMPSPLLMTGAAALRCEDVRLHFAHFCVLQLVQRTLASYNRCEDVRLQNAKAYFCFLQLFQRTIVHRAIVHRKILQLCTGQNKAI